MRSIIVTTSLLAGLLTWAAGVSADDAVAKGKDVQPIMLDEVRQELVRGAFKKPIVIDSEEALNKLFEGQENRARVKKVADFSKQVVLFFGWSGSGQDKLTYKVAKKKVQFQYTRGLTRDLRPHFHVFAVNKDMKWEVQLEK
jgi:hypothetical protein